MTKDETFNLLVKAGVVKQAGTEDDRVMLYEIDDSALTEYGKFLMREAQKITCLCGTSTIPEKDVTGFNCSHCGRRIWHDGVSWCIVWSP